MPRKKLLLADDDIDDRSFFLDFFEHHEEFEVLPSVESGLDLVNKLNTIVQVEDLPDLIIIDQNVPKMTGKQALEYLKADKRFAHIPVIIYSTYRTEQLVVDCYRSGAAKVVSKPFSYEGYKKMINEFLSVLTA